MFWHVWFPASFGQFRSDTFFYWLFNFSLLPIRSVTEINILVNCRSFLEVRGKLWMLLLHHLVHCSSIDSLFVIFKIYIINGSLGQNSSDMMPIMCISFFKSSLNFPCSILGMSDGSIASL